MPTPPAGATTIVINWHWQCADPPPPLDVAQATICNACNLAISVRVASPGDTGDVTQAVVNEATAVATGAAQTTQALFEPVAPVPADTGMPAVTPGVAWLGPPVQAAGVAFLSHSAPFEAGVLFDGPPGDDSAEDPPRHGAPVSFGAPLFRPDAHGVAGRAISLRPSSGGVVLSPQRSSAGRAGAGSRTSAGARRPAHDPAPPTAPPPVPAPVVLVAGAPAAHGGGSGAVVAFASALTLAFLYAIYSALRTGSAVPPARDSGANPHPPG